MMMPPQAQPHYSGGKEIISAQRPSLFEVTWSSWTRLTAPIQSCSSSGTTRTAPHHTTSHRTAPHPPASSLSL